MNFTQTSHFLNGPQFSMASAFLLPSIGSNNGPQSGPSILEPRILHRNIIRTLGQRVDVDSTMLDKLFLQPTCIYIYIYIANARNYEIKFGRIHPL